MCVMISFNNIGECNYIILYVILWIFEGIVNVGLGCEMNDFVEFMFFEIVINCSLVC